MRWATFILSLFVDDEYRLVTLRIPRQMDAALETVTYLNEGDKEELILIAIEDYLIKNIYATKENGNRTKFKRMKQLR